MGDVYFRQAVRRSRVIDWKLSLDWTWRLKWVANSRMLERPDARLLFFVKCQCFQHFSN